jgi:hypothetical protein
MLPVQLAEDEKSGTPQEPHRIKIICRPSCGEPKAYEIPKLSSKAPKRLERLQDIQAPLYEFFEIVPGAAALQKEKSAGSDRPAQKY